MHADVTRTIPGKDDPTRIHFLIAACTHPITCRPPTLSETDKSTSTPTSTGIHTGCLAVTFRYPLSKNQPKSVVLRFLAACLLLISLVSLPVSAGTITGQIQTETGGAIKVRVSNSLVILWTDRRVKAFKSSLSY